MPDDIVLRYLRRNRREGALWTMDIAEGVRQEAVKVRRALRRLEKRGLAVQVVKGRPSSWEAVPDGESGNV